MEHTIEYTLNNDEIYKILEDEIVSLRIQPGDILSENSLCKRFHVSRTPIRSVLDAFSKTVLSISSHTKELLSRLLT